MTAAGPARRAVFADRDGTLNVDVGYLARASELRLLPGVAAALRRLNEAGIPLVVVTNQSGVARGLIDPHFAEQGYRNLAELVARDGARIDGYYFCPHHPEGEGPYGIVCRCRKPASGMLERAAGELNLRLEGSFMIGDKLSDVQTGAGLGIVPLLVRSGSGRETEAELPADFGARGGQVFDDFAQAVEWVLTAWSRRR
jgi:D-glycero-D-manno-heptose 1,7-bisphosphate phosphatase